MQTIYLDLSKKGIQPLLYAKQADVGRKFKAILTDGGVAYPVPAGAAVSIWYSGSSGDGNYTDVGANSAVTVSGNEIVVEMIAQMLTNYGVGTVCIVLHTADGNQLGTWNIPYMVEPLPGMGSAAAKEYFTAFSKAVEGLAYPDASLSAAGKAADAAATGAALAGKAPAGYGLGTKCADLPDYDWNNAILNGWYTGKVNAPDSGWWFGSVNRLNETTAIIVQRVYRQFGSITDANSQVCAERRGYSTDGGVNTTWTEWEYVNPPMKAGAEYRTTERYLGKPVYTMTVECENFSAPNSTKLFVIESGVDKLVSSYATVSNMQIPTAIYGQYNESGIIDFSVEVDDLGNLRALYATKSRDLTSKFPTVTVKYTKL